MERKASCFRTPLQRRKMSRISMPLVFGLACALVQAQWIKQPTVGIPRTPDGKPDLMARAPRAADGKPDMSGLWTFGGGEGGLSQLKTSEIQPWAETLSKQREENLAKDSPFIQCLPSGFL